MNIATARVLTDIPLLHTRRAIALGVFVMSLALSPSRSFGQVDAFWMRSWNEAQKSRPASMTPVSRIAPKDEPGTPLVIRGQVFLPDGRTPAADIVVHTYHRDHSGFDFGPGDKALTTWRLQAWAKTDKEGRFEFQTIRPAPDSLGREGPHVHFTLESAAFGRQWAPTLYFNGDPLLSADKRRQSANAGEFAWIREVKTEGGVQHVTVKIRLKPDKDF